MNYESVVEKIIEFYRIIHALDALHLSSFYVQNEINNTTWLGQNQFSSSNKRSKNHLTAGSESSSKSLCPEVVFSFLL